MGFGRFFGRFGKAFGRSLGGLGDLDAYWTYFCVSRVFLGRLLGDVWLLGMVSG